MPKRHDMEQETPFILPLFAELTLSEVKIAYGAKYATDADADALAEHARRVYMASESFRKKMNYKDPRPLLKAFMLHWHASTLLKRARNEKERKVARDLADKAWYGQPLPRK